MMLSDSFEIQEEKPLFQVIFLKNDISQSVWVEEADEINFSEIRRHLKNGESVFITSKRKNKLMTYQTDNRTIGEALLSMAKK